MLDNRVDNINWNLINRLNKYDIVFVRMTDSEIQKGIDVNHQKRPFLIMKKSDKKMNVFDYYLTGNISNKYSRIDKFRRLKLVLSKSEYNISKNSLVHISNETILPYENIIKFMDHINDSDLSKLKKYRNILYKTLVLSNMENMVIEIGDIIVSQNRYYLIYQIDNINCYGYHIYKVDTILEATNEFNYVCFNKQLYFIDFNNKMILKKDDDLYIIDRFSNDVVDAIKRNKKLVKHYHKVKNKHKKR